MKYSAIIFAASAALVSAQAPGSPVTYNSTTGVFTCTGNPNGDYCAGDSLSTNIIIRCTNGIGQPGNCNDNLSGDFPYGVNYAPCWQSSPTSGDAACSKNCIVEGGSGNYNGTFTLPNCTPSSSSTAPTSTSTSTVSTTSSSTVSTTSGPSTSTSSASGSITVTSTGTTICTTGSTTTTKTFTTTYCPSSTLSTTVIPPPISTGTGSSSYSVSSNGTISTGSGSTSGSATATPVGPTKSTSTGSPQFTGGAIANAAAPGLAAVGLAVAYFL